MNNDLIRVNRGNYTIFYMIFYFQLNSVSEIPQFWNHRMQLLTWIEYFSFSFSHIGSIVIEQWSRTANLHLNVCKVSSEGL